MDLHAVFVDGIGAAANSYWPTLPPGTLPGHRQEDRQFITTYAPNVTYDILIWTGIPPDPTLTAPGEECAVGDPAFAFLTYNQNAEFFQDDYWAPFDGLRGIWDDFDLPIQENNLPMAQEMEATLDNLDKGTYRLSYHPDVNSEDVGFGAYGFCSQFAWAPGNGCGNNINQLPPASIGPCQDFVPLWQCDPITNLNPNPFFCDLEPSAADVIDSGVVPWWTDADEFGIQCGEDVDDLAPFLADCGTAGDPDDELAKLLNGDCFWDRETFPTYFNSYVLTPGGPQTPWGARPLCYNGPMCDNINCCDAICAVNPECCVYDVGVRWTQDCADVAFGLAFGLIDSGGVGGCTGGDWAGRWFPNLPESSNPTLGPNLVPIEDWQPSCGQVMALTSNGCFSASYGGPYEPGHETEPFSLTGSSGRRGGCSDLNCCNFIIANAGAPWDTNCVLDWGFIDPASGLSCSDQARLLCYPNAVAATTPDYTPLQFHLQGGTVNDRSNTALQALAEAMPEGVGLLPAPYALHLDDPSDGNDPIDAANPDDFWPYQSLYGTSFPPLGTGQQLTLPERWNGAGLTLNADPLNPLSPSLGLYSWGEWLAQISEGNHPAGPNVNGTKGRGVKIAVLDLAAWVQEYNVPGLGVQGAIHEDLTHIKLEGRDTPHPNIRMLFDEALTRPQRGTGILGLISAAENGFGVTGVAPEADTYFFPLVDADLGFREVTAWLNAIDTLQFGDILLATYLHDYYHEGPDCAASCLINDPSAQVLMGLASDTGIKIVTPAGDNACEIGAEFDTGLEETSDVTIVAGAMPSGRGRAQRWWTSNYDTNDVGDFPGGGVDDPDDGQGDSVNTAITCSFWGGPYVTTGGDMGLTETFRTDLPFMFPDPTDLTVRAHTTAQMRAGYTNNFGNNATDGGSVAASAVVSAVLACAQGFSLQRYDVKQSPTMLKQLVWDKGYPKTTSDTQHFNSQHRIDAGQSSPYYGFDLVNAPGAPWNPQRSVDPAAMGTALVVDGEYALDDGGLVTDYNFIKGVDAGGALASLRERDDIYVVCISQMVFNSGYVTPTFYCPGPVYYSAPGHYVDMLVEYTIPSSQPIGNFVETQFDMPTVPVRSLIELHTWNWVRGQWQQSSDTYIEEATEAGEALDRLTFGTFTSNYHELVNGSGKMYQRVKIQPFGLLDGPGSQYRIDHINLDFRPGGYDDGPNGSG